MPKKWTDIPALNDFWRDFDEALTFGDKLRDYEREGKEYKKHKKKLEEIQKEVHKDLDDKKLVERLIHDTSLRYRDTVIVPLQNKNKNLVGIDWWHPLYLMSGHQISDLLSNEWTVELEKALKMAIRNDNKQGGHRQEALEKLREAEKMERKTDKRHKALDAEIEEGVKSIELVKSLKKIKISQKINLKEISNKLIALEENVIDIRMKQNKRIEKEKGLVVKEGRDLTEIKAEIREAYGDPRKLKRVSVEFDEVKENQKERINKENLGENIGDLVNKLRREVKDINRKQMQRIEKENLRLQEKRQEDRDKEQDDLIAEREQKDKVQDEIIARLRAELDVLKGKVDSI